MYTHSWFTMWLSRSEHDTVKQACACRVCVPSASVVSDSFRLRAGGEGADRDGWMVSLTQSIRKGLDNNWWIIPDMQTVNKAQGLTQSSDRKTLSSPGGGAHG